MPRKPIDYKKSVIYTIKTGNGLYVGSTTDFTKRKYQHKSCIYDEKQKGYNCKLYQNIRANNFEWDMKPYKEYPCENKIQLTIEEERVRCELRADLNMNNCHGKNEEKKKEWDKKYYKKYYKDNEEQMLEHHKKYYIDNKDKMLEQQKKYRIDNKDKINEKTTCECGCIIRKYALNQHLRTKKHEKLMKILKNNE